MKNLAAISVFLLALIVASTTAAQDKDKDKRRTEAQKPLVLESQGSFFVGGETKSLGPPPAGARGFGGGDITINQMYVQYQIPPNGDRHVPIVMVHGC